MIDGWRACTGSGLSALTLGLVLAGCGGDAGLKVNTPAECGGGEGPQVRGTVQMPEGRVAQAPAAWERVAAALAARASALTGDVSPVRAGVDVQLVELRQEDVVNHRQPGVIATADTNADGEYCMGLVSGTDQNVCRYVVQVGSVDDGTLTRAFVFSTEEPIVIDYRSEAAVRVILAEIPPSSLCDFNPDEIRAIYEAIVDAPGDVTGGGAAEVNAVAASLAASDPGVVAAVDAAAQRPPTATPAATRTRTATSPPRSPTSTGTPTRTGPRPTRTPNPKTPTPSTTVRTRTATPTPTNTGALTTTPALATATVTSTRPTAAATTTPTVTPPQPTTTPLPPSPTPTTTTTPGAALGERIFTIRAESQFPGQNPRVGFFTSALGGFSVTNRFTEGPLILVASAPDANSIAPVRLKEDVYFAYNIPPGGLALCWKLVAENSSGFIDCNGGTAVGVELVEAAGDVPSASPVTGKGPDGGPGALQLNVRQAVAEIDPFDPVTFEPTEPCDAGTEGFSELKDVVFTTGNYLVKKGSATLSKDGENFDCGNWTETDGVGMILTGVTGFDPRSGNAANVTRLADR